MSITPVLNEFIDFLHADLNKEEEKVTRFLQTYIADPFRHHELLSIFYTRFSIREGPLATKNILSYFIDWLSRHMDALYYDWIRQESVSTDYQFIWVHKRIMSMMSLKDNLIRLEYGMQWSETYHDLHDYVDETNREWSRIYNRHQEELNKVREEQNKWIEISRQMQNVALEFAKQIQYQHTINAKLMSRLEKLENHSSQDMSTESNSSNYYYI